MASKTLLLLAALAVFMLVCSEVSARDLAETPATKTPDVDHGYGPYPGPGYGGFGGWGCAYGCCTPFHWGRCKCCTTPDEPFNPNWP